MNDVCYPISNFSSNEVPFVEFIDSNCKPLIVAPITHASRLKLGYKVIWLQIIDSKRRIYLSRRASHLAIYPNFWDFSASGYVLVGESYEDAAFRELHLCFGINNISLSTPRSYFFSLQENFILSKLYIVHIMKTPVSFCPQYIQDGMFVDQDEIIGFSSELPELLTPSLLWAVHNNILFK